MRGGCEGATDRVNLKGNIHVTSSHGYDMRLSTLDIDTKAGIMKSDQPVTATQKDNKISADRLQVIEKNERPDQPAPGRRPDSVDRDALERPEPRTDDQIDDRVEALLRHQFPVAPSGSWQKAASLLPSGSRK